MTDLFKTFDGVVEDLDDLSLYPEEWKKTSAWLFMIDCCDCAAKSLFYMDYYHRDIKDFYAGQKVRVLEFVEELLSLKEQMRANFHDKDELEKTFKLPLMKWRARFEDETENQC